MTLQQITYFCAICEEMHYTKAANKVHVSQPSLSYAVRELEEELDVKLFRKNAKKISLTEYGEIFYQYAQRVLNDLDEGIRAIEAKKKESQEQVNVGYLFSISVDFLAPLISKYYDYSKRYDQIFSFEQCKSSEIVELLALGKIDIGFATDDVERYLLDTPLEMVQVCQQELFVAVRNDHLLADKESVLFEEVKNENFVAINPGKGFRIQMDHYFKKMNTQPRIIFSVNDSESLLAYIEAGVGVGIMPQIPSMNLEKLRLLRISDYPIRRNIVMLFCKNREYNSDTRDLINFVKSAKFKI